MCILCSWQKFPRCNGKSRRCSRVLTHGEGWLHPGSLAKDLWALCEQAPFQPSTTPTAAPEKCQSGWRRGYFSKPPSHPTENISGKLNPRFSDFAGVWWEICHFYPTSARLNIFSSCILFIIMMLCLILMNTDTAIPSFILLKTD